MAGAALCAAAFLIVYLGFVQTASGQLIDVALREVTGRHWHPLPELDPENRWIAVWIMAPPAGALAALTIPQRDWLTAGIAVATVVASNITTQVVKHGWLERPELIDGAGSSNALPSGHTTMAAASAVAVFLAAGSRWRPAAGVLAAVWGAGWGAYIYLESWHRPSDMIAAYLVVAGWGLVGGWLILRLRVPDRPAPAHPRPHAPELMCAVIGVLLCGAALVGLYAGGGWSGLELTLDGASSGWHWVAGTALSAGPAWLLAAAGISLFRYEEARLSPRPVR